MSGVFFCLRESGGCTDAFAGKPAPTLDRCFTQIPCGSGLAREEAITENATFGTQDKSRP
ncbi:hypothetical protein DJ564_24420 [Pseudomonas sp. 31-12]|nr:hypothetical protein DJ564_24420 [Pseudomonas sp. 31-12]